MASENHDQSESHYSSMNDKTGTSRVEEPDLAGTYTYADYLTWQLTEMVELIHGKIYKMSPAPRTLHQQVTGEIYRQLANSLKGKKCRVFIAPFDVRLPSPSKGRSNQEITTVVQPDLCVICDLSKIDELGCLGPPDLIIEVLSPSTSAKDMNQKFSVYEETGVAEYWVVNPKGQTVLVYTLNKQGKYEGVLKPYMRTDKLAPQTLPGLIVNLEDVFEEEAG